MADRPGGAIGRRPLQFFWIVDCSGSMQGKKIESLNLAIRESIRPMQDVADENPNAEVQIRVLTFANSARWHVATPVAIHQFKWRDLDADGLTAMGEALEKVAAALRVSNMPARGLPPVLVLITDGQPTDDFSAGLKMLLAEPWGVKAVRIAIGIGDDVDYNVLQQFIGNSEVKPLSASNVQDLALKIKWASTVPLKAASNPNTKSKGQAASGNVPIPQPPDDQEPTSVDDVF